MQIKTRDGNLNFEFNGKTTIGEMLESLSVNPDTVLVSVNGELRTSDEKINEKDEIELIAVVSGG
jgi:sulfur carrier protein